MGKEWSFFMRRCSGFLEIAIMHLTSRLFFDLLFYVLALNHFLWKKSLYCLITTFYQHFVHLGLPFSNAIIKQQNLIQS